MTAPKANLNPKGMLRQSKDKSMDLHGYTLGRESNEHNFYVMNRDINVNTDDYDEKDIPYVNHDSQYESSPYKKLPLEPSSVQSFIQGTNTNNGQIEDLSPLNDISPPIIKKFRVTVTHHAPI